MAESLSELKARMDARNAAEQPEVVPVTPEDRAAKAPGQPLVVRIATPTATPTPPIKGDDLMDRVEAAKDFTTAEKAQATLIKQSMDLIIQKGKEDPEYGKRVATELGQLQGEQYAEKAIDEADKLKIDYLKKSYPERFNGPQAAFTAFANEATFGQLSRIIGKAGELVSGLPAEQVTQQKAEEFRLLEKAYPGLDFVGKAAAYLIPGSPVRATFETFAKLGSKGAAAIIARVVKNPKLMAKAVQAGAAGAMGAGAVSAVKGAAGTDNQQYGDLDRMLTDSAKSMVGGGVLGAATPLAGAAITKGVEKATPAVKATSRFLRDNVPKAVGELANLPKSTLRSFLRNPKPVQEAAGSEFEIGNDLISKLEQLRHSNLPEQDKADELLDFLPDVSPQRLVGYLRSFKPTTNPDSVGWVKKLNEWADRIEATLPKIEERVPGAPKTSKVLDAKGNPVSVATETTVSKVDPNAKIPARQMRGFVKDLQDAADEQFGQESNFVTTAIKIASRRARMEIIDAAKEQVKKALRPKLTDAQVEQAMTAFAKGDQDALQPFLRPGVAQETMQAAEQASLYMKSMEKVAEKVNIIKFIRRQLGRDPVVQAQRAQAFVDRVFGKNKTFTAARLAEFDSKFGTNFLERAKLAQEAQDLGLDEKGALAFFTRWFNGRAGLGVQAGGAIGGMAGGLAGAVVGEPMAGAAMGASVGSTAGLAASMPFFAARIIGTSDQISGFMRRLVAKPEVIQRLAGQLAKKGGTEAEKNLARISVPVEIRRLAEEISTTLTKDGPRSAGSVVRLIADTPYFAGLVHYWDLMDRRAEGSATTGAVEMMKEGQ